jgi:hypothetical protein
MLDAVYWMLNIRQSLTPFALSSLLSNKINISLRINYLFC